MLNNFRNNVPSLILTFTILLQNLANSQCCLKFDAGLCVQCPEKMHLYRSNCIYDLPYCITYSNGFDCQKCEANYELIKGKCQKKKDYQDIQVDIQNANDQEEIGSSFLISDDLLRSLHPEIQNGQVTKAIYRKYLNGTIHSIIEYKADSQSYKGIIQVNLNTFIFREIKFSQCNPSQEKSFEEASPTEKEIIQSKDNQNGYEKKKIKLIDLKNQKLFENVSKSIQNQNDSSLNGTQKQIKTLQNRSNTKNTNQDSQPQIDVKIQQDNQQLYKNLSANTSSIFNESQPIPEQGVKNFEHRQERLNRKYSQKTNQTEKQANQNNQKQINPANNNNAKQENQEVLRTNSNETQSSNQTATEEPINQETTQKSSKPSISKTQEQKQPSIPQKSEIKASEQNQNPSKPPEKTNQINQLQDRISRQGYKKIQIPDLRNDLCYIVAKNQINKKHQGYSDILPREGYTKTTNGKRFFILVFEKKDSNLYEVDAQTNIVTYDAIAGKQVMIPGSKPGLSFKEMPKSKALKQIYFLITMDKLNKKLKGKYKNAEIKSIGQNSQKKNIKYYRIIFELDSKLHEVIAQIKLKTFTVQVKSDKPVIQFQSNHDDQNSIAKIKQKPQFVQQSQQKIETKENSQIINNKQEQKQIQNPKNSQEVKTPQSSPTTQISSEEAESSNQSTEKLEADKMNKTDSFEQNLQNSSSQKSQLAFISNQQQNKNLELNDSNIEQTNQTEVSAPVNTQQIKTQKQNEQYSKLQSSVNSTQPLNKSEQTQSILKPKPLTNLQSQTKKEQIIQNISQQTQVEKQKIRQKSVESTLQPIDSSNKILNQQSVTDIQKDEKQKSTKDSKQQAQKESVKTQEKPQQLLEIKKQQLEKSRNEQSASVASKKQEVKNNVKKQKNKSQSQTQQQQSKRDKSKQERISQGDEQIQLNPLILAEVIGFRRLSNQQLSDDELFKKVKQRVKLINQEELSSAKLVAAFVKGFGFTREYRIYYDAPNELTYQAHVTFDILRRRIYILSFGNTGFSLT